MLKLKLRLTTQTTLIDEETQLTTQEISEFATMCGWDTGLVTELLTRGFRFDYSNEHLDNCHKPHGQTPNPCGRL